jgi:tRNA 5-methylaminomethyl-2-thiouridine biosynthesis bifunctional protein
VPFFHADDTVNTQPIQPARIQFNEQGLPWSPAYADIYHPQAGAFLQAEHVFLAGNGLPDRWQTSAQDPAPARFCILEIGFGLGHNFLATWQAWRQCPGPKPALDFISLEKHPLTADDLRQVHRDSPVPELTAQLQAQWPSLTPNLHALHFEGGQVRLLLGLGDALAWLPELEARVDAYYLDGFAPAKNPELWQARVYKALARLAAPGATLATWSAARGLREGLRSAGFEATLASGKGGKRDITLARYAPAFTPRPSPRQRAAMRHQDGAAPSARHALIIGAGLAGCATAWALARQGWRSTVIDRRGAPAQEASGNPAGLFHGVVHGHDGIHARFNRAAALRAHRAIREALGSGMAVGEVSGLLRLQTDGMGTPAMQAVLDRLGLPADYVQALDASQAGPLCGLALHAPAWFYPQGGWIEPGHLCRHWLSESQAEFCGGTDVQAIQATGGGWKVLDARGAVIAEAPALVLANAGQALALLGQPAWGVENVRGQISHLPWPAPAPGATGLHRLPRMPVAGAGYLLPEVQGRMVFGATSQAGDMDATVRLADHQANLSQLERLLDRPLPLGISEFPHWQGRTGWRCMAPDRLPIAGAVPDEAAWSAMDRPADQPRRVPRRDGLHVCMALGSRGITWAALAAEVVACGISGAARPLESSLLDAIDPARFLARQARRPG